MISLAQQIHKSHIIGNQDHQKMKKKKIRERERDNLVCVIKEDNNWKFIIRI